jgi:hypothetical protein
MVLSLAYMHDAKFKSEPWSSTIVQAPNMQFPLLEWSLSSYIRRITSVRYDHMHNPFQGNGSQRETPRTWIPMGKRYFGREVPSKSMFP